MDPASIDLSVRLLRDGYDGLEAERRRQGHREPVVTRMLGRRTVVVRGPAGARLFYDPSVVRRSGAVPPPLRGLIFGRGGVQGLDGRAHAERKSLLLDLLADARTEPLVEDVDHRLRDRIDSWRGPIRVFDQLVEVYGGAVLAWAGIRVDDREAAVLSRMLAEVVDGIGFSGAAYLRGWRARLRLDRWATALIRRSRDAGAASAPDSPVARIAARGDLDDRTAGVELLNVLRPTVAVAWPGTLALNRLLREPAADRLAGSDRLVAYLHECRRLQPFAPALAGRVRRETRYRDTLLHADDRIILDIVGSHADPDTWAEHGGPAVFQPDRFAGGGPDPFTLVPQGGGFPATGHRCPGEPLAVRLLEVTARNLARADLRVVTGGEPDRSRIPALPQPPLRVIRADERHG